MIQSNANLSRDKIPMWINIINIIVICILVFQMVACFVNPSWAYGTFENSDANRQAILTLAGRNFVMIAVTLLAMRSQNAMLLGLIFLMNFAREFYDMILVGYLNHFSIKGFGMMATFLVFLIPYIFALKKLQQLTSSKD
jgi:uncharacterized membrane protein